MADEKVTIKELSEYCNVSTATISRVINNNGRFSEETRQKVLAAIEELGYIPNTSAKSLRTRTSRLVGIFVNALDYEMSSATVTLLQEHLFEQGYTSIICNIGLNGEREEYYYQLMLSLNVCSIFLLVMRCTSRLANRHHIPMVYMYKNPFPMHDDDNVCLIDTDDFGAGRIAGDELHRLGCRSIAEVRLKSLDDRIPLGRHLGLLQSMYEHNVPFDESLCIVSESHKFSGILESINKKLDEGHVAEGYFCSSDLLALALIRGLEMHGYRIPEQVKVIGCNDLALAKYNNKAITSIRHRMDDICLAAIDVVNRMIAGEKLTPQQRKQTFSVDLISRETT